MLGPFVLGDDDVAGRQFYAEGESLDTFGWLSVPRGRGPEVNVRFQYDDGLTMETVTRELSVVDAITKVHRPDLAEDRIGVVAARIQSHDREVKQRLTRIKDQASQYGRR